MNLDESNLALSSWQLKNCLCADLLSNFLFRYPRVRIKSISRRKSDLRLATLQWEALGRIGDFWNCSRNSPNAGTLVAEIRKLGVPSGRETSSFKQEVARSSRFTRLECHLKKFHDGNIPSTKDGGRLSNKINGRGVRFFHRSSGLFRIL